MWFLKVRFATKCRFDSPTCMGVQTNTSFFCSQCSPVLASLERQIKRRNNRKWSRLFSSLRAYVSSLRPWSTRVPWYDTILILNKVGVRPFSRNFQGMLFKHKLGPRQTCGFYSALYQLPKNAIVAINHSTGYSPLCFQSNSTIPGSGLFTHTA